MHRETIVASLTGYMRVGICVCASTVFSVVSAPILLADPIHDFDLHSHSDIFSLTPSGSAHTEHDFSIFRNSLPSGEPSFSPEPSFFTSFGDEDHSLHEDSLADKRNHGLHLGWGTGVEHNHHHHYSGGPASGSVDLPTDLVAEPEPSTTVSFLSGLAIVFFFSCRRKARA